MGPSTLFPALCAMFSNPTLSNFSPCILTPIPLCFHSLNPLFTSFSCFFPPVSSAAADKEGDDYYTRKRHLPDLAARGTLPLHVLKMSQDQVGTQVLSTQNKVMFSTSYASVSQSKCTFSSKPSQGKW